MLCWQLWFARNALIFDGRRVQFMEVVDKATRSAQDYKRDEEAQIITSNRCISSNSWCAPPASSYKLNTDAGTAKDGLIGLGGVVHNHEGDMMMATCLKIEGISDVDVAEALSA